MSVDIVNAIGHIVVPVAWIAAFAFIIGRRIGK